MRSIFIIDCYVRSKSIEKKLIECVKKLNSDNKDILLISNSIIDSSILEYVNYFIYDKENHLFSSKMESNKIIIRKKTSDAEIVEYLSSVHRHGLSVLRNLFKSIKIAKEYGYTHFHRVEVDDLMGNISLNNMYNIPIYVLDNKLDGLFLRYNNNEIYFHYMFSSINFFLENIKEINTEDDYISYIKDTMEFDILVSVEQFLSHNLEKFDNVKILDRKFITDIFPDTSWNTEISTSNVDEKYKGCTTKFYKLYENNSENDKYAVLSYNYNNYEIVREIKIISEDNEFYVTHNLEKYNDWESIIVSRDSKRIDVYENGDFLFSEFSENVESYIVIK